MIDFEIIKDIREDNDLTQEKMAKILSVNRSTYSSWESGVLIPIEKLYLFAQYFNYSIDYCLGLTKTRTPFNHKDKLNLVSLGNNLVRLRKSKNLSQRELATTLGVSHSAINKYEKGNINIIKLYEYSNLFKITMQELLTGTFKL